MEKEFNIFNLAIGDTADYHVTDAAGNPQYFDAERTRPVTITVVSPGTKKGAAAEFKRNAARSDRTIAQMSGKTIQRNENDDINERAAFLAEITTGMNFDMPGGALALYKNLPLGHVADGVEKFYNDRGNFIKNSAASSSSTPATQPG